MDHRHLTALCRRYTSNTSDNLTRLPGLSVFQREATSDIEAFIYDPIICLILQGSKTTSIGNQLVDLQPGDALIVSHDLPVTSRITKASADTPYLALILSIDLGLLRGLYEQVAEAPLPNTQAQSLAAGPADRNWVDPLVRYLELADNPLDAKVLGPSVLREIHYRLLLSPLGGMLRRLLIADSHASRISKAIGKLRSEFHSRLSVPELARFSGMSASSFHAHFKSVTGVSPLQYQKDLRLIEARSLLVEQGQSVAEASFSVGYESPTHFSRDYARKFGVAPSRDTRAAAYEMESLAPRQPDCLTQTR